jgi:hypothetical protein
MWLSWPTCESWLLLVHLCTVNLLASSLLGAANGLMMALDTCRKQPSIHSRFQLRFRFRVAACKKGVSLYGFECRFCNAMRVRLALSIVLVIYGGVNVDNQYIAVSALRTLTAPVLWDASCEFCTKPVPTYVARLALVIQVGWKYLSICNVAGGAAHIRPEI